MLDPLGSSLPHKNEILLLWSTKTLSSAIPMCSPTPRDGQLTSISSLPSRISARQKFAGLELKDRIEDLASKQVQRSGPEVWLRGLAQRSVGHSKKYCSRICPYPLSRHWSTFPHIPKSKHKIIIFFFPPSFFIIEKHLNIISVLNLLPAQQ